MPANLDFEVITCSFALRGVGLKGPFAPAGHLKVVGEKWTTGPAID
jgi:hypothetical protein